MKKRVIVIGAVLLAGLGLYLSPAWKPQPTGAGEVSGQALVDIVIPESFSQQAQIGKTAFDANCAGCHGVDAVGQNGVAPPLVHVIYEPSHHGDESFQRAIAMGVRGHHWPFGDMPPVEGLTRADVATIIAYIRELQRANGID